MTPARITRAYRREASTASAGLPWALTLSDEQRSLFRDRGKVLAEGLLQYLDSRDPAGAAHHLKQASVSAADYGRVAARLGLSLSQTVEGFLRFRAPFLHELSAVALRRGFDTAEATDLLETAERGMDQLLVATMTGHSVWSSGPAAADRAAALQAPIETAAPQGERLPRGGTER
jgi:hypothetical protein